MVGVPVAMACDGVNSLIYLFRGEKLMAGASALAVIPFVGSFGKATAKTTIKLTAEEAAKVAAKAGVKNIGEIAERIARGHAYADHVDDFAELGIKTEDDFIKHVKNVMDDPTDIRNLSNDRIGYYDKGTQTVVVFDLNHNDFGSAFIPKNPKTGLVDAENYFYNLLK